MSRVADYLMTKIEARIREDGSVLARTVRKDLERDGFVIGTDVVMCEIARSVGFVVYGRRIVKGAV